jgi:hypothetical protein
MEQIVLSIATALGIEPESLAMITLVVVLAARALGNRIPDDATGFPGIVRKVAKVVGVYVPNRITSGANVNDIARAELNSRL